MSALGLVVVYFLINAPDLFVASDPNQAPLQILAKNINYGAHLSALVLAIVNIVTVVVESVRLVGRKFAQVHHAAVGS
jgi:hypothetical protein